MTNMKMQRESFLQFVVLFSLFFVLSVYATEKQKKRVYFAKKFTGGHFDRVGKVSDVYSYIQCASLCLTSRPQCQSFNLKWQNNKTKIYRCEILNEVPKLLNANEFKTEENTAYFELIYNETTVLTECTLDDSVYKNMRTNCTYTVIRLCADQNTYNCSLTEQVYCIGKQVKNMTWSAANEKCNSLNGKLAEDKDEIQHQILLPIVAELSEKDGYGNSVTWLGGYGVWTGQGSTKNKTWYWQDESRVTNEQWAFLEPNNDGKKSCIAMTNFNMPGVIGKWVSKPCDHSAPFICEYWIRNRL